MQVSTIRPGYLVSLKTSLRGNVSYVVRDIETEGNSTPNVDLDATGTRFTVRRTWETTRTTADVDEYNRAIVARSKARSCVLKHCVASTFGYLCPEAARSGLERGIAEARTVADEFNATARMTRIVVNTLVGRIAADDVEAIRAINGELRDLLSDMAAGVASLDVKAVREAANKATQLAKVLSPEASERARAAIEAARKAANDIRKAGETAGLEIDRATIKSLEAARTAFLDTEEAGEIGTPDADGRAVDFAVSDATDGTEDYNDLARRESARAIDWE